MDGVLMGGKKQKVSNDPISNLDSTSGSEYPMGLPAYTPPYQ
jgi:hypothetical protein